MVANKGKTARTRAKRRSRSTNGKPAAYEDSIRRHLAKVPGIEVVYIWIDPHKVIQVVSVVNEHDSRLYDLLLPGEEQIEKENPKFFFDFHVRMRQNRELESILPSNSTVVLNKL